MGAVVEDICEKAKSFSDYEVIAEIWLEGILAFGPTLADVIVECVGKSQSGRKLLVSIAKFWGDIKVLDDVAGVVFLGLVITESSTRIQLCFCGNDADNEEKK